MQVSILKTLTKAEVELWFKSLADAERAHVTGFFTTVRRAPQGGSGFAAVPYSEEYHTELAQAAQLLREATSPHRAADAPKRS